MTSHSRTYRQRRDAKHLAMHYHSHPEPAKPSTSLKYTSQQNTPVALVRLRCAATIRSRKVKPSMPKMPWDQETPT